MKVIEIIESLAILDDIAKAHNELYQLCKGINNRITKDEFGVTLERTSDAIHDELEQTEIDFGANFFEVKGDCEPINEKLVESYGYLVRSLAYKATYQKLCLSDAV